MAEAAIISFVDLKRSILTCSVAESYEVNRALGEFTDAHLFLAFSS